MTAKVFLDTNVLVYAYDTHEPAKQARAKSLLEEGIREGSSTISVQVLSEFFTVVTRHIPQPLSIDQAQGLLGTLSIMPVLEVDLAMVNRAVDTHKTYGISYWDALIVAAAERGRCSTILTEDLSDGQVYHDILVTNPFLT